MRALEVKGVPGVAASLLSLLVPVIPPPQTELLTPSGRPALRRQCQAQAKVLGGPACWR